MQSREGKTKNYQLNHVLMNIMTFRWYHLKRKRLALLLAQLRKVDIFRCIYYLRI